MKDYITSTERLTFMKRESKFSQNLWTVLSIVSTYVLLIQLTTALGGV